MLDLRMLEYDTITFYDMISRHPLVPSDLEAHPLVPSDRKALPSPPQSH